MLTNLVKYKQAEVLRKEGNSYVLISTKLGISKSTLSNWFGKKNWSNTIKSKLNYSRLKMAKKNLLVANLVRSKNQLERRKKYLVEAKLEFNQLIKNPLFLIGLGIYWGRGR